MYNPIDFTAPQPTMGFTDVENPYAAILEQRNQQALAEWERQQAEADQENQSNMNTMGRNIGDYLGQSSGAGSIYGGNAAGMVAGSPGINAAGGTLQSSMAAPLAQSSGIGTGIGGGSVVGPTSSVTPMMSTAGTTAGTSPLVASGGTAAGGSAAGGSAAGGTAAGAGLGTAATAAGIAAIPLAVMAYEDNQGINSWNQNLTNPGGAASARADHFAGWGNDIFGDNEFGDRFGDWLGGGHQVIMPGSFGDWWDGTKKITGADRIGSDLQNLGSSIGDLFSGWF